jgi:nucleoid-associated protein YgaU
MARVIVILALMLAITAAMVAITRRPAITPGEAASEPSTTVRLGENQTPEEATDTASETASVTSAEARPLVTPGETASAEPPAATAQEVTKGPVAGAAPSFGTAGIDNKGRASFTGTATPGDKIALLSNNKPMGSTTADAQGNWALDFKAPKSDQQQELLVSAQAKDGSTIIGPQRAVIRPPVTQGGLPQITLKAADQTATTLQQGNASAPEAKTGLVVEKVTGGENGLTTLTGRADAGADIKVAINGKPAGETRVAADGTWTLAAANTSGKAADSVRLELIDKDGATLDSADVPAKVTANAPQVAANEPKTARDFPSVLTSKPQRKGKRRHKAETSDLAAMFEPSTPAVEGDASKQIVIKVRRGDSLWRIARRHLGKGKKWAAFYEANKDKIDNPDLIYPGQRLIIPG